MSKKMTISEWRESNEAWEYEEDYEAFDNETYETREAWSLDRRDGGRCEDQQNALLDLIARGIQQLAAELHLLNKKIDMLHMQEQSQEPAAQIQVEQIQEAEDENQAKH